MSLYEPTCIVCLKTHEDKTVEHIIPRALGNIHYVLQKGCLCGSCNSRFSKYEHSVLNSEQWLSKRKELGLVRPDVIHNEPLKKYALKMFLMKIMFESLYYSRRKLFYDLGMENIRNELSGGSSTEAKIISGKAISNPKSIPQLIDKWRLSQNHMRLSYVQTDLEFWFEFSFSDIHKVLNVKKKEM